MTRPRKPSAPPPRVVAGRAGFDDEPIHVAELWVREIEQARDMIHQAREHRCLASRLRDALSALQGEGPPLSSEARSLHAAALELDGQAVAAEQQAWRIRAPRVAKIAEAIDRAEQRARGEQARTQSRNRVGNVTRSDFDLALEATLGEGQSVTPAHIRSHWPNATCPGDRQLYELIRDRWSAESK
jgi:hypothetical protein